MLLSAIPHQQHSLPSSRSPPCPLCPLWLRMAPAWHVTGAIRAIPARGRLSSPPVSPCCPVWACPRTAGVRVPKGLVGAESGAGRARVDPVHPRALSSGPCAAWPAGLRVGVPGEAHVPPLPPGPVLHWEVQQPGHRAATALTACDRPLPRAASPAHLGQATASAGQQCGPLSRVPQRWAQPATRVFTCAQDTQIHPDDSGPLTPSQAPSAGTPAPCSTRGLYSPDPSRPARGVWWGGAQPWGTWAHGVSGVQAVGDVGQAVWSRGHGWCRSRVEGRRQGGQGAGGGAGSRGAGVGGMEAGTEQWGLWGCCGLGSRGGGPWGHNEPLSRGQAS